MNNIDEKTRVAEIVRDIPKGIIGWYDFSTFRSALYIGEETDSLYELLKSQVENTTMMGLEEVLELDGSFDCVTYDCILVSTWFEKTVNVEKLFKNINDFLLSDTGRLLITMNNRLGIRYLCGDRDPYTKRNFDSIENYRRAYTNQADSFNGRSYSKCDMERILAGSGLGEADTKFYAVYPGVEEPTFLYAEGYVPNEDLSNRIHPTYNYPQSVFLEEDQMYNDLVQNDLFHKMANAYLVEVVRDGVCCSVEHVTNSIERGRYDALYTIIKSDNTVTKKAVYEEGIERLSDLNRNINALKKLGIKVVEGKLDKNAYTMPFISAITGQKAIKDMAYRDRDGFIAMLERFRDIIWSTSEIADAEEIEEWKALFRERIIDNKKAWAARLNKEYKPDDINEEFFDFDLGVVLKNGFMDLVPLNSFYIDGDFVFYDQEFCLKIMPANVIIYRLIATLYSSDASLWKLIPMDELLKHFGLYENRGKWAQIEWDWLGRLWNKDELTEYHKTRQMDHHCIGSNRQRMNYSAEDYQRLFVDIFENADSRKVILFGSGNFAKKFIKLYGADFDIYKILDNSSGKWGESLEGIEIASPDILLQMAPTDYKLIVCIKNYLSVMEQLDTMGIKGYSIYDGDRTYPKIAKRVINKPAQNEEPKKFNVGYVAGVFDLFHIGHLNLLRRAKEQCNYLIVGVVSDEGVVINKKTNPFIPFDDRIEIVRSCKYVDEAVEIPHGFSDTEDAYKLYHFDVQFSGSDYEHDSEWMRKKKYLNDHGAELVFFPYTQSTSSTKLKKTLADNGEKKD